MRKILTVFIVSIIFLALHAVAFSQKNIKNDSLQIILNSGQKDSSRVKLLILTIEDFRTKGKLNENMIYVDNLLSICDRNLATEKDPISNFIFWKGKAKAFNAYGTFKANKINPNEGIKSHFIAVEIQKDINAIDDLIESYSRIGTTYWRLLRDYDKALEMFYSVLQWASKINNKKSIMEAYKWISSMYSLKSDNQKTLENRNLWLTSAKEIHDKKSIAEAHTDIGLYFDGLGNFQDALVHHNSALQSHLEWMKDNKIKENTNSVADCYHNIGNVNMRIGNYTNALKYYFLALKIREETKNRKGIGVEKEGIAHTYYAQNNFVDALANYTQALKIFEEFKDDYFTANCYANIGKVYLAQEVCPEARENILKSLTLREGIKHKPGISESHLILAAIYLKEKKSNEALNHAFKCLKIAEQINNKTILAAVKLTIGKVYMSYPDSIVIAKKYVKEAISISEEISLKTNLEASYRYLAEINYKEQNYESAYHSFRKSSAYNDSLTNRNVIEKLAQLRMQYDFDKKEDSLNYQQQITGEQLKQQTLFSQQQQQSLLLKEKELALISKEKDLQELEYFKTQAELQVEQSKRKENEDQLTIAEQEKSLQKTKLDLQTTQLGLQNKELQAKKTQRNIFIAGTIALLLLAFFIFRNYQNQQKANKLMKVAAEKERIELQLQSLRAQLNPHFMFNSLNAIQELIVMEENEKSQSYLERFAKLLRMLLENANEPFIPLRKEVNFLELYLSLEKLRLPDLEYSIEIDPQIDQQKAMTPNMMLQPYVENALWHGLQHKQGEKNLQLHIVRQNGSLTYEIKDNGVGRKKAEDLKSTYRKEHRSKGMELLSQRFNLLSKEYGQNIQTTITDLTNSGNATGTLVKITIPYSIELDKPAS